MDRPTCVTCPYWKHIKDADDEGMGFCLRYAPRPVNSRDDTDDYMPAFPLMCDNEWCGEHPRFTAYLFALNEKSRKSNRG